MLIFIKVSFGNGQPPVMGIFWSQSHYLNKFKRRSLDDVTYQISRPCGFRQEDFHFIFYYSQTLLVPNARDLNLIFD